MFDFIMGNYTGTKVTLAVTGLPVTLTGEVLGSEEEMIKLKLENGTTVCVNPELIAFVF